MTTRTQYWRQLLEAIEGGHGHSQRALAAELGIALGLVNLLLKELQERRFINMVRLGPSRAHYELTLSGRAEKARLSHENLALNARVYASARDWLRGALVGLSAEWTGPEPCRVVFAGAGEVAEIGFVCLQSTSLQLVGVLDRDRDAPFFGLPVHRPSDLRGRTLAGIPFDRLAVMAVDQETGLAGDLAAAGVPPESVFSLSDWRWSNSGVDQSQAIGPRARRSPAEALAMNALTRRSTRGSVRTGVGR